VSKSFHKGEKVTWSSHGGTAEGEVLEEITSHTEAADRTVRASKDDPQYRVRSEKSGGEAVHKPSALEQHRHLAQRPTKERIEDSRWRYSLMNWGHDPCKR
jgi:hypothetical protein